AAAATGSDRQPQTADPLAQTGWVGGTRWAAARRDEALVRTSQESRPSALDRPGSASRMRSSGLSVPQRDLNSPRRSLPARAPAPRSNVRLNTATGGRPHSRPADLPPSSAESGWVPAQPSRTAPESGWLPAAQPRSPRTETAAPPPARTTDRSP